jgi:hypothetical protein
MIASFDAVKSESREHKMDRNVNDITAMGWSEEEILQFDPEERKQLGKTARKILKQAAQLSEVQAMGATAGQ